MAELEAHELIITEGDVEALYLGVNEYVEPVLIVLQRGALRLVKHGSESFNTMLRSKTTCKRILGVYDFMVSQKQLREDLVAFGARIV
jgi:hypothetical protein